MHSCHARSRSPRRVGRMDETTRSIVGACLGLVTGLAIFHVVPVLWLRWRERRAHAKRAAHDAAVRKAVDEFLRGTDRRSTR